MDRFTVAKVALSLILAAAVVCAEPVEVKWCVPYDQPKSYARLCGKALAPANNEEVTFSCVIGKDPAGCMKMMSSGDAHLTTLDGGDVIAARTEIGAVPLLFENYGVGVGASYYAVAAVKKEFCTDDTTLESLKGKRSCHTGYRKTAGWLTPVGTLLSRGVMEKVSAEDGVEDDAESVAGFFSGVCAPRTSGAGPKNGPEGAGVKWDPLCESCQGDCTTHDRYYDYQGAFRCMMEDAGDVAFIKHSTIPDYAQGGAKAEEWATSSSDEFMLMCSEGGCKPVSEYETCHLAKVPAHAVVAPKTFAPGGLNAELGESIQAALVAAAGEEGFFEETTQLNGQENFIFKKGTAGLDAVTTSFEEAMGTDFLEAFEAFEDITEDNDGDR